MENFEKQFDSKEALDNRLNWWLADLAADVWLNEWVAKVAVEELNQVGRMSNTIGCVLTSFLDKVYANKKKFNQLSQKNKKTLELIVNNRRGDVLPKKYNLDENNCKQGVRDLMVDIQQQNI